MSKRKTTSEFISQAQVVHGNQYDYSKVTYVNSNTKVCIICPIHGEFLQTPDAHIRGQHCPKCMGKDVTTGSFVGKARLKHGNKYDYSKVRYTNNSTKVCIICPEHGEFWQTPANHLRGSGCPECAHNAQTKSMYGVETNDSTLRSKKAVIDKWRNMIRRCYSKDYLGQNPTYRECSVCAEWLKFSNFEEWIAEQGIEDIKKYDLDKDLFSKGSKLYSPDTCCLIPHRLNTLLVVKPIKSNGLPRGIYKRKDGKYRVILKFGGRIYNSQYATANDAFEVYKRAKETHIKKLAYKYYMEKAISKRVYDALMEFEVNN